MSASNFHAVPKVSDTVSHLDADVVVEVLSRHALNVSDAAREWALRVAIFVSCCWLPPHSLPLRRRWRSGGLTWRRRTFTWRLAPATGVSAWRPACSLSGIVIALASAVGLPARPARQSFPSTSTPTSRGASFSDGGALMVLMTILRPTRSSVMAEPSPFHTMAATSRLRASWLNRRF